MHGEVNQQGDDTIAGLSQHELSRQNQFKTQV